MECIYEMSLMTSAKENYAMYVILSGEEIPDFTAKQEKKKVGFICSFVSLSSFPFFNHLCLPRILYLFSGDGKYHALLHMVEHGSQVPITMTPITERSFITLSLVSSY